MFYLFLKNKNMYLKIAVILITVFIFLAASGSSITQLGRLAYTEEATATVIDRQLDDSWHITITYTHGGNEYKAKYQNSYYRVGDKFNIFLNPNNSQDFIVDNPTENLSMIFSYIVAAIWVIVWSIVDISHFVFRKKLVT